MQGQSPAWDGALLKQFTASSCSRWQLVQPLLKARTEDFLHPQEHSARETDLCESHEDNHDLVRSLFWYLQNKIFKLERVGFFHLSLDFQIGWEQEGSSKIKTYIASDL